MAPAGASPAPTVVTAASPSTSQASFAIDMPIAVGDSAAAAYGIWPFGVHGGGHAADGHPGFDLEFRPGALLKAPASGVVSQVMPDPASPALWTLAIQHGTSNRFRTDYTNLASLSPGIAVGSAVVAGQALGTPATMSQFIGPRLVTWAMTHFQVDDFNQNVGSTNSFAASPELYLSANGRAAFDAIWHTAAYHGELTEPFPGNSRTAVFPMTRTWTKEAGGHSARVDFTRRSSDSSTYQYALLDASGMTVERGDATVDPQATPLSVIDLQPETSTARRAGVWNVIGDQMYLDYGAVGAVRPSSLRAQSVYRTLK